MNRKGFTLIELLATFVVLAIVVGITIIGVNGGFGKAKEKTEEVFVDAIRDAMNMYLSTDASSLSFSFDNACYIDKTYGRVRIYKTSITFNDVINSSMKPITKNDLVNPYNKDVECKTSARINIYRDADYVYYYSIDKSQFGCLKNTGGEYSSSIDNLPDGYACK